MSPPSKPYTGLSYFHSGNCVVRLTLAGTIEQALPYSLIRPCSPEKVRAIAGVERYRRVGKGLIVTSPSCRAQRGGAPAALLQMEEELLRLPEQPLQGWGNLGCG